MDKIRIFNEDYPSAGVSPADYYLEFYTQTSFHGPCPHGPFISIS